jgi:hypothetical protein
MGMPVTHVSEAEEAPIAFWVTSAQVKSLVNHSFHSGVEPTEVNKSLDGLWEALVPQSSTNHRLSFRDVVPFLERNRVTVGIGDERVGRRDEVRLGDAHEFAASDVEPLSAET